jgi:hypothetical protein
MSQIIGDDWGEHEHAVDAKCNRNAWESLLDDGFDDLARMHLRFEKDAHYDSSD